MGLWHCLECGEGVQPTVVYCQPCGARVRARRQAAGAALRLAFPTLDASVLNKLARAELSPADVFLLTDDDALAIRGIGATFLERFRSIVPLNADPIENWVGEGVPGEDGEQAAPGQQPPAQRAGRAA